MGWFGKSAVAAVLFIIPFISVGFFNRNFGLKPEVILVWYGVGLAVGCFGWTLALKTVNLSELSPSWPLFVAAIIGALFSALPNILLYQSLAIAPNPGLTMAVINVSTVLVFFVSLFLSVVLPRWFVAARFDWVHLTGIILTVAGVALLSFKR